MPKFKTSSSVTSTFYPGSCHAETPFQQGPFLIYIYLYRWASMGCQPLIPWTALHCTRWGNCTRDEDNHICHLKQRKMTELYLKSFLWVVFISVLPGQTAPI